MDRSIKVVTSGKVHLGLSQGVGALRQVVAMMSVRHLLPSEMFTHGVPYEASRTYSAMKSEFECRRALAMVEVQRQALRGF